MSVLKLSKLVINTAKISSVKILPNYYVIELESSGNYINKNIFSDRCVFETGSKSLHFSKEKQPDDYDIIHKWFNSK